MGGLGFDPYGAAPLGFALPETAADPPAAPDQARYLDFISRDYRVASDGELERMPIVRQRVLLALATIRSSSTVLQDFGVELPPRIDARYEAGVRAAVRVALRHLIADGSIVLKNVTVDTTEIVGRAQHMVEYIDVTTGEEDKAKF